MEKLESVLKRCSLIEQIWVYGNSYESSLVAVVVPQQNALKSWAAKQDLHGSCEVSHPEKLCLFCGSCWMQALEPVVSWLRMFLAMNTVPKP